MKTLTAATADDLDDYTYRVAGCVGEFWTRITRQHCFPDEELKQTLCKTPFALAKACSW